MTKADKGPGNRAGAGALTELLLERAGKFSPSRWMPVGGLVLREHFLNWISSRRRWHSSSGTPRLVGMEARGESAVLRGVAHFGGTGARAASAKQMKVTLQLEVAQRLMGKRTMTITASCCARLQLDYEPRGWFQNSPRAAFPAPNVDSACVTLGAARRTLAARTARCLREDRETPSQRRKMMLKLLKTRWPAEEKLQQAFTGMNISPMERAEKLSLEQFVNLTKLLAC